MIVKWSIINPYSKLVKKIKKEIVFNLQRKGIMVSQIDVDLKQNNVSLKLSVSNNLNKAGRNYLYLN
ncbi:MAG: hypothetical protein GX660_14095 [Clostridiaceae bacterium]|nr:hypothetical protein [Clostridiaceae bacterium]